MTNRTKAFAAIAAVTLIVIGAISPSRFWIVAILIGACIAVVALAPTVRAAIRNLMQQLPFEARYATWVCLTILASIGAITYWFTGIQARYINSSVYFVTLVLSVIYMHRIIDSEGLGWKIAAVTFNIMTIACLMKLFGFLWVIGFVLAIVAIILFWDLHRVATRRPNQQQDQRQQQNQNQNNGCVRLHARVPWLRIPIPFFFYSYDPSNGRIVRERFVFLGHGSFDPELFKNIQNVQSTDKWNAQLQGCFSFQFQTRKFHEVEYREWHCVPVALFDLYVNQAHY